MEILWDPGGGVSDIDEVEEAIQRLAQTQDDDKLPAGTVVGGRFVVSRLLGEGAMGAVYQATQH